MTVKLLVAYHGLPVGARLSRNAEFEAKLVAEGKATLNLAGSFDDISGPDAIISMGPNAPDDEDGRPDGSIHLQY